MIYVSMYKRSNRNNKKVISTGTHVYKALVNNNAKITNAPKV